MSYNNFRTPSLASFLYSFGIRCIDADIWERETMVLGCIEANVASAQYPLANVKRSGLARGLLCILESNLDAWIWSSLHHDDSGSHRNHLPVNTIWRERNIIRGTCANTQTSRNGYWYRSTKGISQSGTFARWFQWIRAAELSYSLESTLETRTQKHLLTFKKRPHQWWKMHLSLQTLRRYFIFLNFWTLRSWE